MATATQMYGFRIRCWNGVPADDPCAASDLTIYPFLDAAWRSMGHITHCPDGHSNPGLLQQVADRIRPMASGIYPVIEVVCLHD
jgi:hypothetical protein